MNKMSSIRGNGSETLFHFAKKTVDKHICSRAIKSDGTKQEKEKIKKGDEERKLRGKKVGKNLTSHFTLSRVEWRRERKREKRRKERKEAD